MKTIIVPNNKFSEFARSMMNNLFVDIISTKVQATDSVIKVDAPDFAEFPDYVKVAS